MKHPQSRSFPPGCSGEAKVNREARGPAECRRTATEIRWSRMSELVLPLRTGSPLIVRDSAAGRPGCLDRLALLTGGKVRDAVSAASPQCEITVEAPSGRSCSELAAWRRYALLLDRDNDGFVITLRKGETGSPPPIPVGLWQLGLLTACISAVLRGARILPVHGALLAVSKGGLLLCGQSGMGKSTTSRRWQAAGGSVPADDMVLLECGGEEVIAHPLPTWSRCRESLEGASYPFEPALPVAGVFALARGEEREELKEAASREFFMSIYSACCCFASPLVRLLPQEERERLLAAIRETADRLAEVSPPTALFAHLDGNLQKTLKDYL